MTRRRTSSDGSSAAFSFVLTMGAVNLFSDMTYEAGGAMNGQFMASLGATAAVISITAGVGEFLGYSLRSVAGWAADRTGRYWAITFLGYVINLLAVPAMALVGNWQVAALLILAERIGRAIRKPTVEAMLSYTTARHGKGWVYAVNTALDESGATLGPLVVAAVLFLRGDYRMAYALLLVPTILALAALVAARVRYPVPSQLEEGQTAAGGFTAAYFLYMGGAACFGAGLLSYELVAYHLAASRIASELWIPVLLALATGCGVIASLILGKTYDKAPLATLLTAVLLSSLFAPLLFLVGGLPGALAATVFLGVGYATQDTLLKAVVASTLPEGRRNFAFGLFYTGYGVGWLVGSVAMGLLYDHSRAVLVAFAMAAQLASMPLFIAARRRQD